MEPRTAILICTHDRPQFLEQLLEALRRQQRPEVFLVIVDNGSRSAEPVVARFRSDFELYYRRLQEPGLVVARNASIELALKHAPGLLAFIDDDEIPKEGWLEQLATRLHETDADFVTGPVEAKFVIPPPHWAIQGDFFNHDGRSYRTSNLAIRTTSLPKEPSEWFQIQFNRLGGEDGELLDRLVTGGAVHEIAHDAVVMEFVPAERLRRRYIWRCGFRDGAIISETIFTRHGTTTLAYARCLLEAFKKLGYSANHLFWVVRSPWRFNSAVRDFNAAAGIIVRMAGAELFFYGANRTPAT